MPLYVYECGAGHEREILLRLSEMTDKRPCAVCGEESELVLRPAGARGEVEIPVVVHVAADGSFSLPAHADAPVPEGYHRRELRTIRQMERFEREANARLSSEADADLSSRENQFSQAQSRRRSDLRQSMQRMSPLGRALARLAMEVTDRRRSRSRNVGLHLEILNFDQSNREAQRDELTDWKRRHG